MLGLGISGNLLRLKLQRENGGKKISRELGMTSPWPGGRRPGRSGEPKPGQRGRALMASQLGLAAREVV